MTAPTKTCPECEAEIPLACTECPLCGHALRDARARRPTPLGDFIMTEIDLLKRSSFEWVDLFGDDAALMANGFNAWGGVFFLNGRWHGVGGSQGRKAASARRRRAPVCLAQADDWLNDTRDRRERPQEPGLAAGSRRPKSSSHYLPPEYAAGLRPDPLSGLGAASPSVSTRPAIRALVFGAEREQTARAA